MSIPVELRHIASADGILKRSGILSLTVDLSVTPSMQKTSQRPSPSRWKTPEFLFYGVVFVIVIPQMVWRTISLSSSTHPNYALYRNRLSEGWIYGREMDNSDAQYRLFRDNIPALTLIAGSFLLAKHVYLRISHDVTSLSASSVQNNFVRDLRFRCACSIIFLLGLHGANFLKIFLIASTSYSIAKIFRNSLLSPILTWVFNFGVLFLIERYDGFPFASISPSLAYLDSKQGVYHRWFIPFNITMLRLVSFNMDYYWADDARDDASTKLASVLDSKQRCSISHEPEIYSFINFLTYALYPPLYLAGPIITFNDFMWQHLRPSSSSSWSSVIKYLIRFSVCLLTMELILHCMYVVAIKDAKAWHGDTPFELSMIGLWNLIIVWLKLLLPWRFFRLWSLADGIDPPENMVRCMANNYSSLGFWRGWHRSYNLWIVRYIYIPLGGTENQIVSTVLIFSFVALWHDLKLRLLAWGWLVSLFIMPEIIARYLLPPSQHNGKDWYRHVCAVGAVFNILMMMTANLVGFVLGLDGTNYLVDGIFGTFAGLRFLLVVVVCLFIAVQVMFEYREEEMRNGIYRKY